MIDSPGVPSGQCTGSAGTCYVNAIERQITDSPAFPDLTEQAEPFASISMDCQVLDRVVLTLEGASEEQALRVPWITRRWGNHGLVEYASARKIWVQVDIRYEHEVLVQQVGIRTDGDELLGRSDLIGSVWLSRPDGESCVRAWDADSDNHREYRQTPNQKCSTTSFHKHSPQQNVTIRMCRCLPEHTKGSSPRKALIGGFCVVGPI